MVVVKGVVWLDVGMVIVMAMAMAVGWSLLVEYWSC